MSNQELTLTELNRKVGEHIMGVNYDDAVYMETAGMYFWKSDKTMLHEHQFTSELNMAWVVLSTFVQKYGDDSKFDFVYRLGEMLGIYSTWGPSATLVTLFNKLTPEIIVRAVWAAYEGMEGGQKEPELPV